MIEIGSEKVLLPLDEHGVALCGVFEGAHVQLAAGKVEVSPELIWLS
jgi:hypothetical protein